MAKMKTKNNKVVKSIMERKYGGALTARRYAAFAILYILLVTVCVTGLLFGSNAVNASSGAPAIDNGGASLYLYVALGILSAAFAALTVYFAILTRRKA